VIEPSPLELPITMDQAIPELEEHPDGLLCVQEPCRFITRSLDRMKRHWREDHGWRIPQGNGRRLKQECQRVAITVKAGYQTIICQQIFPSQYGSQYIQI
jgi:ribosomal protein L32E